LARTTTKKITAPYEATPRESEAHARVRAASRVMPRAIAEMVKGQAQIAFDHPDQDHAISLVQDTIGAPDAAVFVGLFFQLANASLDKGEVSSANLNFMLGVMKDIAPRDTVETMLASQMAAVQMATMTFARRLAQVETIQQQDSAERAFNKLARTFTMQMEALKRYRTGGQQKVTVEHVTVNEGGQAIVGSVETGGRGHGKR
jgi:hypothetical protein